MRKAAFEGTKKKEVGVSDLTLLSKISNEAINDNLKKRFEAGIIYVRCVIYLPPYLPTYPLLTLRRYSLLTYIPL